MTQSNDVIAIVVVVLTVVLLVGGYVIWRWRRSVLLRRSVQYDSESSRSSSPAVIIEDEHVLRVPERVVVSERRRVRQVSGYHGVGRPGMQEAPQFRRPFVVDAGPGDSDGPALGSQAIRGGEYPGRARKGGGKKRRRRY
ncbi:hypothetical protein B0T24DRAFT_671169 [Lasiosphaeria ovina]|uniref:Uncharacterized protein n=1 Tax=Lasiosphaeria ovina TaxID=92902 RepID=A0AAE0JTW5_9PEZI|nr:hypothetical protein B0T24DRAFT_671169 [Lasiosphaeria ovina]